METTEGFAMEAPVCPVGSTQMLTGDKWKVLILRNLMDGVKRFGELPIGAVSHRSAPGHGGGGAAHPQGL